jgi:hypothetical protein
MDFNLQIYLALKNENWLGLNYKMNKGNVIFDCNRE